MMNSQKGFIVARGLVSGRNVTRSVRRMGGFVQVSFSSGIG